MKNIPEFIALIKRYETVTLEEIESQIERHADIDIAKEKLTGIGYYSTCTLCKAISNTWATPNCHLCVYKIHDGCFKGSMSYSYRRIKNCTCAGGLLKAYRSRAAAMRKYAKENNINLEP